MRYATGIMALALTLVGTPSMASERDATVAERERVTKHLKNLGYSRISDVDVVNGRFEADARSKAGRDVDVILDMNTLRIVRENAS